MEEESRCSWDSFLTCIYNPHRWVVCVNRQRGDVSCKLHSDSSNGRRLAIQVEEMDCSREEEMATTTSSRLQDRGWEVESLPPEQHQDTHHPIAAVLGQPQLF
ncbi:unnamed protein product [Natator depressus]